MDEIERRREIVRDKYALLRAHHPAPLPALVGNKRVHRGVGDVLVITYQETALLLLPATVLEGPPQKRRSSMAF